MVFEERAVVFDCDGERLIGVVSVPDGIRTDTGVLVIVGGPQYRAGSHRQFTLLCRHLAESGISCMRFDYRGMGDSTGNPQPFDQIELDIRSAIDAFEREVASVKRVVLWGLCDGASAASLYSGTDSRVAGLVLVNPWVRTEQTKARTYLRHYYLQRLFEKSLWLKAWAGKLVLREALGSMLALVRAAYRTGPEGGSRDARPLPTRMATALRENSLPILIVLSGRDYVAREFDEIARADSSWAAVLMRSQLVRFSDADHTFSHGAWRTGLATATSQWLSRRTIETESGQLISRRHSP